MSEKKKPAKKAKKPAAPPQPAPGGEQPAIPPQPESEDLVKQRNEKCLPIVREIYDLIQKKQPKIGDMTDEEKFESYDELARDILKILLDNDVKLLDVNYIFRVALQPVDILKDIVVESLNHSLKNAQNKFWGKDSDDVTMSELDTVLKK